MTKTAKMAEEPGKAAATVVDHTAPAGSPSVDGDAWAKWAKGVEDRLAAIRDKLDGAAALDATEAQDIRVRLAAIEKGMVEASRAPAAQASGRVAGDVAGRVEAIETMLGIGREGGRDNG